MIWRVAALVLLASGMAVSVLEQPAVAGDKCAWTETARGGRLVCERESAGSVVDAAEGSQDHWFETEPACYVPHGSSAGDCEPAVCPGGGIAVEVWEVTASSRTFVGTECVVDQPPDGAVITAAMLMRAVRGLRIAPATLSVQPPGGRTLVNFETIVSTEERGPRRTFSLLGLPISVILIPASYTWHWGDRSPPSRTDHAGERYDSGTPMRAYITHTYRHAAEEVHPRVDIEYAVRYRVGGGAWQPVADTVMIPGQPSNLRVVEAQPVLVGTD